MDGGKVEGRKGRGEEAGTEGGRERETDRQWQGVLYFTKGGKGILENHNKWDC